MSNNQQETLNACVAIFSLGTLLLGVGAAGLAAQGIPFTLATLIFCLIIAGFSIFLLPFLLALALLMIAFPPLGLVVAVVSLVFFYNAPLLSLGLGTTITFLSVVMGLNGQSPQSIASQKVPSTPFSQENATPSDSREYNYEQEVQENDPK